jgi:hypothetical protein
MKAETTSLAADLTDRKMEDRPEVYKKSILALSVLALLMSGTAQAGIVGNGPPNQSGGSDLNSFLEGDDFVVASPGVHITQIRFWTLESAPTDFAGSVDWAFYSDLGGFPNVSVVSGNAPATGIATGNTTFGLNEFSYTLGINAGLTPGAYWLVLHNGPSNVLPATNFYWAWSNGDAGNSANLDLLAGPPWVGNSAELAFELTAAPTPEPVSMSLVGGGILAACLLRRKAKGLKG